MAEILPDEGLAYVLDVFPRRVIAPPEPLYVGLFSSQSPTTVPGRTAVLATGTGVTELGAAGGYVRVPLPSARWGPPAVEGNGVRVAVPDVDEVAFPESTAAYSAPVHGFFLAPALTGGPALYYSNFDTLVAYTINAPGFSLRVTPRWRWDG